MIYGTQWSVEYAVQITRGCIATECDTIDKRSRRGIWYDVADVANASAITAPESLLCIGSLLYGLFPRDSDDNE